MVALLSLLASLLCALWVGRCSLAVAGTKTSSVNDVIRYECMIDIFESFRHSIFPEKLQPYPQLQLPWTSGRRPSECCDAIISEQWTLNPLPRRSSSAKWSLLPGIHISITHRRGDVKHLIVYFYPWLKQWKTNIHRLTSVFSRCRSQERHRPVKRPAPIIPKSLLFWWPGLTLNNTGKNCPVKPKNESSSQYLIEFWSKVSALDRGYI